MKSCVWNKVVLLVAALAVALGTASAFAQPGSQAAVVAISVSNLSIDPAANVQMANYNGSGMLVGGKIVDNTIVASTNSYQDAENRLQTVIQPLINQGANYPAYDYGAGNGTPTTTGFTDPAAYADFNNVGVPLTGVFAVVNQDLAANGGPEYSSFGGKTTTDNSILIAHSYVGDSTLKGSVSIADFINWNDGFQAGGNPNTGGPATVAWGDFLGESAPPSISDFIAWNNAFQAQGSPIWPENPTGSFPEGGIVSPNATWTVAPAAGGSVSSVPEPGTVALLIAAVSCFGFRFISRRARVTAMMGRKLVIVFVAALAIAMAGVAKAELVQVTLLADQSESTTTGVTYGSTPNAASTLQVASGATGTIAMDVYASLNNGDSSPSGITQIFGGFYQVQNGTGGVVSGTFSGTPMSTNTTNLFGSVSVNPGVVQANGNIAGTSSSSAASGWWGGSGPNLSNEAAIVGTGLGTEIGTVYFKLGTAGSQAAGNSTELFFYPMANFGAGNASPTSTQLSGFTQSTVNANGAQWRIDDTTTIAGPVPPGIPLGSSTVGTSRNIHTSTASPTGSQSLVSFASIPVQLDPIASTGPTYFTGQASIVGLTVQPTVLSNSTGSVTAAVQNTANPSLPAGDTQDNVNWTATSSALLGSLAPSSTSGTGLNPASNSSTVSFVYTPKSLTFGFDTVTLTPSGTNQNLLTALAPANLFPASAMINVVGVATTGGTDGTGIPGSTYGPTLSTGSIAAGGSYAGLQTQLGNGSGSIGNSFALILAGTNGTGAGTTVTEAWRSRASTEIAQGAGGSLPAGGVPLFSDVVNLAGTALSGGTASSYALQMSYDPNQVALGTQGVAYAASNGFLYLGYRTAGGSWVNAIQGNAGGTQDNGWQGPSAVGNYQGTFAAFTGTGGPGAGDTLASLLGSWGVDTVNNTVWAVVDHSNSEFAAVPEPGTLVLLAAGVVALGVAYRRRKVAQAA